MFLIGRRLIKDSDLISTLLFYICPLFLVPPIFIIYELFIKQTFIPEDNSSSIIVAIILPYSLVRYIILLIYFNATTKQIDLINTCSHNAFRGFILLYEFGVSLSLALGVCTYPWKERYIHSEYYIILTVTNFISCCITWLFLTVYCPYYILPKLIALQEERKIQEAKEKKES